MKEVVILMDEDGETTSFSGFEGKACYEEAKRLISAMKDAGLEVDIEKIIPNETGSENDIIAAKLELEREK